LGGFEGAVAGFEFFLAGHHLALGSGEGFGLVARLFEKAAGFEIAGKELGVHGDGGEKGVEKNLLPLGERRKGSKLKNTYENFVIKDGDE
jgi:hypothetical protein